MPDTGKSCVAIENLCRNGIGTLTNDVLQDWFEHDAFSHRQQIFRGIVEKGEKSQVSLLQQHYNENQLELWQDRGQVVSHAHSLGLIQWLPLEHSFHAWKGTAANEKHHWLRIWCDGMNMGLIFTTCKKNIYAGMTLYTKLVRVNTVYMMAYLNTFCSYQPSRKCSD